MYIMFSNKTSKTRDNVDVRSSRPMKAFKNIKSGDGGVEIHNLLWTER